MKELWLESIKLQQHLAYLSYCEEDRARWHRLNELAHRALGRCVRRGRKMQGRGQA